MCTVSRGCLSPEYSGESILTCSIFIALISKKIRITEGLIKDKEESTTTLTSSEVLLKHCTIIWNGDKKRTWLKRLSASHRLFVGAGYTCASPMVLTIVHRLLLSIDEGDGEGTGVRRRGEAFSIDAQEQLNWLK